MNEYRDWLTLVLKDPRCRLSISSKCSTPFTAKVERERADMGAVRLKRSGDPEQNVTM
jgi:hypothetical protein